MKQNPLTLGSLFDGIGGFPFAGEIAGIKPVWAVLRRCGRSAENERNIKIPRSEMAYCGLDY